MRGLIIILKKNIKKIYYIFKKIFLKEI
jgi:hypothetical protein